MDMLEDSPASRSRLAAFLREMSEEDLRLRRFVLVMRQKDDRGRVFEDLRKRLPQAEALISQWQSGGDFVTDASLEKMFQERTGLELPKEDDRLRAVYMQDVLSAVKIPAESLGGRLSLFTPLDPLEAAQSHEWRMEGLPKDLLVEVILQAVGGVAMVMALKEFQDLPEKARRILSAA